MLVGPLPVSVKGWDWLTQSTEPGDVRVGCALRALVLMPSERVMLAVLPATSVSVTCKVAVPLKVCNSAAVKRVLHKPLLDTVTVRVARLPNAMLTEAPASPVPVRVWSSWVSARWTRLSPVKAFTPKSRAAVSSVRLRTAGGLTLPARSVWLAVKRMLPSPNWAHSPAVSPTAQVPVEAFATKVLLKLPKAPCKDKVTVAPGSAAPLRLTWPSSCWLMRSSPATGLTTGAKAKLSRVSKVPTVSLTLPAQSVCVTLSCRVPSPTWNHCSSEM